MRTAGPVEMAHWDLHQGAPAYTGITNLYNNLTYRNVSDGLRGIVPDLASNWEITPDGLEFTFALREGVKWHDGVAFSSADVVATFDRILDPPSEAIVTDVTASRFEMVADVTALDANTVKMTLKRPTPWFVDVLGGAPHFGYAVIYPKHFMDANDQNVRENIPPGTGAFMFKDRLPGEYLEMEANPNYWNPDLPYVDGIKALHIPVWANRGAAVLTGLADFTWNGDSETWHRAKDEPDKYKASNPPTNGQFGIWVNNTVKPFDDVRVRRAVHLAVNREHIYGVYSGITVPMTTGRWLSPASKWAQSNEEILSLPGWRIDQAGKAEDIVEAKALMAEAGYADGVNIQAMGTNTPASGEVFGVAFLAQLDEILGITSDMEIIERGLEGEALVEGNWAIGFFTGAGPADVTDPTPVWNSAFRCGGLQNHEGYCNPEFDSILDKLLTVFDPDEREALIYEAMDFLDQEMPIWPVGAGAGLPMSGIHVNGIMIEDLGGYPWGRYETVWMDN